MDQTLHIRYEALNNIFGNVYYNVNNNEVLVFCPKHSHHKRKLSINIKKNAFRCFVCGYSSKSIFSLLYDYGNKTQRERYFNTLDVKFEESEKIETVDLPDNYTPVLDGKESIGGMIAYRYLRDEIGLPNSTILQSKIGFVPSGDYKGRVIFPSYNKEGQLNYFITRRVDGDSYRTRRRLGKAS